MANAALASSSAQKLTDYVWIGCKLPHGLWLELITPVKESPVQFNFNPAPTGPRVKLRGAASTQSESLLLITPRVHDYGRTRVDRSFWEKWLAANKEHPAVKADLIFAEESKKDLEAHRSNNLAEKTGLEGLNPDIKKEERMKKIRLDDKPETVIESDEAHLTRLRKNMVEVEED